MYTSLLWLSFPLWCLFHCGDEITLSKGNLWGELLIFCFGIHICLAPLYASITSLAPKFVKKEFASPCDPLNLVLYLVVDQGSLLLLKGSSCEKTLVPTSKLGPAFEQCSDQDVEDSNARQSLHIPGHGGTANVPQFHFQLLTPAPILSTKTAIREYPGGRKPNQTVLQVPDEATEYPRRDALRIL